MMAVYCIIVVHIEVVVRFLWVWTYTHVEEDYLELPHPSVHTSHI